MGTVFDCRTGLGAPEYDRSTSPQGYFVPLDSFDPRPVHVYYQYPDIVDT